MRFLLFLVVVLHGLIHLVGFAKAFRLAEMSTLAQQPSTTAGLLWLLFTPTFTVAGGLFLFKQDSWWMIALPAVILSQALIFGFWGDAKFGSIANLIILLPLSAAILEARPGSYHNRYKTAVREGLVRYTDAPLVTEAELSDLRSEEHTSELQPRQHLVCRLLLEKRHNPYPVCPPLPRTDAPPLTTPHSISA